MAIYTFFLEYRGGTYISQHEAPDPRKAVETWIESFDLPKKKKYEKFFENGFRKKLKDSLDLDVIVAIEGLINAWSYSAYRLDDHSEIHFTKTSDD